MKFIGHLDVMRYFQKSIRRAGLDVAYSEGFNPHMIMSFASPLGIGLTSDAEYMDLEFRSLPESSKAAVDALNRAGTEEMAVTGFVQIPDGKANKAMTLVAAADYTLRFRNGHEPKTEWESGLADYFAWETITVLKKTKHSEKEVNIRPMIYDWSVDSGTVFLKLAAGSVENLKPGLVMDAFLEQTGLERDPFAFEINRCEIYANSAADGANAGERNLISLYRLGSEF